MTDAEQQARHDISTAAYIELFAILDGHLKRAPDSVKLLIAVEVLANLTSNVIICGQDTNHLLEQYIRALRHNVSQHLKL